MNTNLNLTLTRQDENILVQMSGDLDISSYAKFTDKVFEEYKKENASMVFDMKNLKYIDSTGLGAFMTLYREIKDSEYTISIINAKDNIKKIFVITELDSIFRMD